MENMEKPPSVEGAVESIAAAYIEYHDFLVDIARRKGFNEQEAEDLVHDTFVVVLKNIDQFMNKDNRIGWIVGILKNLMLHGYRDSKYSGKLQYEQDMDTFSREDEIDLTLEYGDLIDREDFELFAANAVYKFSYKELSVRYGISEAACRKRVQRAKERLRKALEEKEK